MTTSAAVAPRPLELRERVAEDVRAALARRKISGSALARMLGREQTWVSRRLRGEVAFDLDDLEAIARAIRVDVQVFVTSSSGPNEGQPTLPKVALPRRLVSVPATAARHISVPQQPPLLQLIMG